MVKGRSPNYPAVGLPAAIASAKALYDKSGRALIAPEAAVVDMGFKSMNGPARSRLSALKKFGLLEEGKDGSVRLTERALTLLHPQADPEGFRNAVREAAFAPPLFGEFLSAPVGSDDALRLSLLKRGFGASGANWFIQAFRDTQKLLSDTVPATGHLPGRDSLGAMAPGMTGVGLHSTLLDEPMRVVQLPISSRSWATLQAPFPLSEEAWNQLVTVLDAMKPGLVRGQATSDPSSATDPEDALRRSTPEF